MQQDPRAGRGPLFETGGLGRIEPVLCRAIQDSKFYFCLRSLKTFDQVTTLIKKHVLYIDAWTQPHLPSSAFCLLLRLYTLRLTESQVQNLFNSDNVYTRAIGAIFVRFFAAPHEILAWLLPFIDDAHELVTLSRRKTLPFGSFLISLLTESRFLGTTLPRLPFEIQNQIISVLPDRQDAHKQRSQITHGAMSSSSIRRKKRHFAKSDDKYSPSSSYERPSRRHRSY